MKENIDVLVIGTDPPCPRCDLMSHLIEEIVDSHASLKIRHCSFDSQEAKKIGQLQQCKIGTAKQVSKASDIHLDLDAVNTLIKDRKALVNPNSRPALLWTPELDALLEPCQVAAEEFGYIMTPILMVNGKVKHHGSVPSTERIAELLFE